MDRLVKKNISLMLHKIRYFEEHLDGLFEKGIVNGTFHRCIGQEATAVGICHNLNPKFDFVVSNHRNHGHYLAFTEDYIGLINELKGNKNGVTGGLGGSQVVFGNNFVSSGILGSTVSFATGIALGMKKKSLEGIVVCFIGDGALGKGVIYESLNMASLWKLPMLFVVEKNNWAQSTNLQDITAGSLTKRFEAFDIPCHEIESTDVFDIINISSKIINDVKSSKKPQSIIVNAPRLCAHSKGDDDRDLIQINLLRKVDPITIIESLNLISPIEIEAAKDQIRDICYE